MIDYQRTNWYGITYLWRLRGSLLPHCIPAMIQAGVLAGVFAYDLIDERYNLSTSELFVDKYAMQLFGILFGYIAVARLNISYTRYWEGIGCIKAMHSKLFDACAQTIALDRVDDADEDMSGDAFCVHIVRLFMQLSALSIITLHLEKHQIDDLWHRMEDAIPRDLSAEGSATLAAEHTRASIRRTSQQGIRQIVQRPLHEDWLRRAVGRADALLSDDGRAPKATKPKPQRISSRLAAGKTSAPAAAAFGRRETVAVASGHLTPVDATAQALELEKLFTYREVVHMRGLPDPVSAQAHRIYRAVTTRGKARNWPSPPPIVSRVFQELSNGLLAYNHATKIKEVPVPFAYVQFNALLLNTFNVLCPIAVARFTENAVMSIITASLIAGGFTALWLVANELEDPFGTDHNDLPVLQYHEIFSGSVTSLLRFLSEDTWTAATSGEWVPPTPTASQRAREQLAAVNQRAAAAAAPGATAKDVTAETPSPVAPGAPVANDTWSVKNLFTPPHQRTPQQPSPRSDPGSRLAGSKASPGCSVV